jgi:hypothetical protein
MNLTEQAREKAAGIMPVITDGPPKETAALLRPAAV